MMSGYRVAFMTILRREVRRFLRIWPQTLLPPAITMCLYFVIFGKLIGARVGSMGGMDYMTYIVPGLVMMSVIQNSYSNVVSSFFGTKFHHSIEEMIVAPVPHVVILMGYVAGGAMRGLLVGGIVMTLAMFFTRLSVEHLGATLLIVLLASVLFSAAGLVNAIFARSFDDISIIPNFVLTPLTYLGGVFYSIELLPDFWRHLSLVNPIVYIVNGFRYGLLGVSDVSPWVAIAMVTLATVLMCTWAHWLLARGTGIRQ